MTERVMAATVYDLPPPYFSRDVAVLVNCPVCWVFIGFPCDMRVVPLWWEVEAGYHFGRLKRARRKLGLGRVERLRELVQLRHFELLAMVQALECGTRFRGAWAGDYWWAQQSRDRLITALLP